MNVYDPNNNDRSIFLMKEWKNENEPHLWKTDNPLDYASLCRSRLERTRERFGFNSGQLTYARMVQPFSDDNHKLRSRCTDNIAYSRRLPDAAIDRIMLVLS